jgi:hypothetical protein
MLRIHFLLLLWLSSSLYESLGAALQTEPQLRENENDFSPKYLEEMRRSMYVHHGIYPDEEAEASGNTATAGLSFERSLQLVSRELPMKERISPSIDKSPEEAGNLRTRRVQTSCSGISCFNATFKSRFGNTTFPTAALILPSKKGACISLKTDPNAAIARVQYLNPKWNYAWTSKVGYMAGTSTLST